MKIKLGLFTIELVAKDSAGVLLLDGLVNPPTELGHLCIDSIKTILPKHIDYLNNSNNVFIC